MSEHDLPIEIGAVHAPLPVQDNSYTLTETQRETLISACEGGYSIR